MIRKCKISKTQSYCIDYSRNRCKDCPFYNECDYPWIYELWDAHDRRHKGVGLLSQPIPIVVRMVIAEDHVITYGENNDNFCYYTLDKVNKRVVIHDIYVDTASRGKGITKKLLDYLQETYDADIFAKAVRDTAAEEFWKHIATQISPNLDPNDMYEHRPNRRDIGYFIIYNTKQKQKKKQLW